jgi:hypothetical protein
MTINRNHNDHEIDDIIKPPTEIRNCLKGYPLLHISYSLKCEHMRPYGLLLHRCDLDNCRRLSLQSLAYTHPPTPDPPDPDPPDPDPPDPDPQTQTLQTQTLRPRPSRPRPRAIDMEPLRVWGRYLAGLTPSGCGYGGALGKIAATGTDLPPGVVTACGKS